MVNPSENEEYTENRLVTGTTTPTFGRTSVNEGAPPATCVLPEDGSVVKSFTRKVANSTRAPPLTSTRLNSRRCTCANGATSRNSVGGTQVRAVRARRCSLSSWERSRPIVGVKPARAGAVHVSFAPYLRVVISD